MLTHTTHISCFFFFFFNYFVGGINRNLVTNIWVGHALPLCWPLSPGWCSLSGLVALSLLQIQCHSSVTQNKKKNNTLVFLYVMVFSRETTSKLEYYKNYRLYKTGELDWTIKLLYFKPSLIFSMLHTCFRTVLHIQTWDPDVTLRPLSALIWDFFSSASVTWGRCCFAPSDPAK